MSNEIIITNLDVIEPHYDFVPANIIKDNNNSAEEQTWKPLEFWFNKDAGLALPGFAQYQPNNEIEKYYNSTINFGKKQTFTIPKSDFFENIYLKIDFAPISSLLNSQHISQREP